MAAVDVDEQTDELEDLDWDVECRVIVQVRVQVFIFEFAGPPVPCSNPADWLITCRACGSKTWCCEEHRNATQLRWVCLPCGAMGDDKFTWQRIPKGR